MKKTLRVHITESDYNDYIELCNMIGVSLYDWVRKLMHIEYKIEWMRRIKNESNKSE